MFSIYFSEYFVKSFEFLFSRIRLEKISSKDLIQAAQMANAHDFIMKLPKGYETIIEDGGFQISGGQKQRVAIAIKNPMVLLLDEATPVLDAHSKRLVQDASNNARKGRTRIMIAHRLSTIRGSDKMVHLEHGKGFGNWNS
ncbi:hypothetical protein B9Z55_027373 [Caenorhabditis nigoni]|nr:hypothetical protein B9Z55_027373 [Caenorhabditis nigoni]